MTRTVTSVPPDAAVHLAWEQAVASMARTAGGLAPGAGWRQDGVSWTPTTSLLALDELDRATSRTALPAST